MKYLFYTDPHLGLARRASFTPKSLEARDRAVLDYLKGLLKPNAYYAVCLGDLFDRSNNPETVILRGLEAVERTQLTMAGNHDTLEREGAVVSFDVLAEAVASLVREPTRLEQMDGVALTLIPHCRTQTLFEEALEEASEAIELGRSEHELLLLHCNYNSPFATTEQELNLTEERAKRLLERFDFILIGHEHAAAEHFQGRLKIIGSLFPTSFGDAWAGHRALVFEHGVFTELVTPVNNYRGPASRFAGVAQGAFIELHDDLPLGESARLAVKLFEAGAFAVKVITPEQAAIEVTESQRQARSLPAMIETFLAEQDEDLLVLWREFMASEASHADR